MTPRQAVALIAAAVSGGLAHAADPTVQHTLTPGQARDALAAALPDGATGDGRQIYLTDASGTILASAPPAGDAEGRPLSAIIGDAQPLTTFGARAGVLEIALADDTPALAALDQPRSAVRARSPWSSPPPPSTASGAPTSRSTRPSSSAPAPSCSSSSTAISRRSAAPARPTASTPATEARSETALNARPLRPVGLGSRPRPPLLVALDVRAARAGAARRAARLRRG
ncbi:MAG: hypothetical protein WDM84_07745 [Bauldia sp.]